MKINCLTSRKKRIPPHIVQNRHEVIGSDRLLNKEDRKSLTKDLSLLSISRIQTNIINGSWSTIGRWKEGRSSYLIIIHAGERGSCTEEPWRQCFFNWPVRKVQRCDDLLLIHQDKPLRHQSNKDEDFFFFPERTSSMFRVSDGLQSVRSTSRASKTEETKESKWRVTLEFDWSGQVSSPSHLRSADPPWRGVTWQWSRSTSLRSSSASVEHRKKTSLEEKKREISFEEQPSSTNTRPSDTTPKNNCKDIDSQWRSTETSASSSISIVNEQFSFADEESIVSECLSSESLGMARQRCRWRRTVAMRRTLLERMHWNKGIRGWRDRSTWTMKDLQGTDRWPDDHRQLISLWWGLTLTWPRLQRCSNCFNHCSSRSHLWKRSVWISSDAEWSLIRADITEWNGERERQVSEEMPCSLAVDVKRRISLAEEEIIVPGQRPWDGHQWRSCRSTSWAEVLPWNVSIDSLRVDWSECWIVEKFDPIDLGLTHSMVKDEVVESFASTVLDEWTGAKGVPSRSDLTRSAVNRLDAKAKAVVEWTDGWTSEVAAALNVRFSLHSSFDVKRRSKKSSFPFASPCSFQLESRWESLQMKWSSRSELANIQSKSLC